MSTRRQFLVASSAGLLSALSLPLLSACAPSQSPAAAPTAAVKPSGGVAGASPFPAYTPFAGGPKPDYHSSDPRITDGFEHFPKNPFKAWTREPPGAAGRVDVYIIAAYPPPTPFDQNPTWQAINKQLGADVQMNIVPASDYRTKLTTLMAGNDLPDIIHLFGGITAAPALPDFIKAKAHDLTPFLAADAIKDYPNLAAIPTYAWKNSQCVIEGKLYGWPIHRYLPGLTFFFKNSDLYDKTIGADYVPKDADDFLRVLRQLNRPQSNQWAIGNIATAPFNFGVAGFASLFGAPNLWGKDASGKLVRDRETEEYKAALGFMRQLWSEGLMWANAPTAANSRPDFAAGRFALSVEGFGNPWNDFWRQGLQQNPPQHFDLIPPFSARAGDKPIGYASGGFISINVLKKASSERVKELLRIADWLASPFGSQESMLLSYGLEGADYTLDPSGDPKLSQQGIARAGYVPWRYIADHPYVQYQPDLPGYAKRSFDAEQLLVGLAVQSAVQGYYSKTELGPAGSSANTAFLDGINDIIVGRRGLGEYDQLVQDWRKAAGDQVRGEYTEAMAAG